MDRDTARGDIAARDGELEVIEVDEEDSNLGDDLGDELDETKVKLGFGEDLGGV